MIADNLPIKFRPHYTITPKIAGDLIRIEATKEKVAHLPLTASAITNLQKSVRLCSTHYSTQIEGNRLTLEQVADVVIRDKHIPERQRDETEVKGYYSALHQVEQWVSQDIPLTEIRLQQLHAIIMGGGKTRVRGTPYREGQNVIRESRSGAIVYMPPEARDVPNLMQELITWIQTSTEIPFPIVASVAHYQFATVHPYYDGNGRTARLLTTWILHAGGYGLKGLSSLEEYYVQNLSAYYQALSIGPSHNYYLGRAEADITPWISYFIEGMATAFENTLQHLTTASQQKGKDQSPLFRTLDPKQRKVLGLFRKQDVITANQVGKLFGFKPRSATHLCKMWVDEGFLRVSDPSRKKRSYRLGRRYRSLIRVSTFGYNRV